MQHAVFIVMLILPSLQSDWFLSGTEIDDCMDIIEHGGRIKCGLEGSGDLDDYDPESCRFRCSGGARPELPYGVCSGDRVNCTTFTREALRNWEQALQSARHQFLKEWCPYYPKD
ncbi:uncharacterized protein LOC115312790 [Ixodes scapularis]|uniref:uncharacterized protein LOC115312790 n=1 Tax=Ixodes scapularis TaxID=6945 RepID=UPI001A9F7C72|nr:uncharacterized protein LOC115312790 [Ixodes scapularis]